MFPPWECHHCPTRAAQAELVNRSQHFIDQRLDRMTLEAFSNLNDPGICPALMTLGSWDLSMPKDKEFAFCLPQGKAEQSIFEGEICFVSGCPSPCPLTIPIPVPSSGVPSLPRNQGRQTKPVSLGKSWTAGQGPGGVAGGTW